eukprot:jgi/Hompol1/2350/HPOL_005960-RA
MSTFTDIAYVRDKNAIQIVGESHEDVYQAQNKLNLLFHPVVHKSKKQWVRPDRPGDWGERRDSTIAKETSRQLRRMQSEPVLRHQHSSSSVNIYGHPAPAERVNHITHRQSLATGWAALPTSNHSSNIYSSFNANSTGHSTERSWP